MAKPSRPRTEPNYAPAAVGSGSADPLTAPDAPGVLYFDPNPTTARLASAGLRLAGYNVFHAGELDPVVELAVTHGPGGDGSIHCLLLDTVTSPQLAADVLRSLVQVPGATELPGILLVSRNNPHPIPGAESLPSLRRPFTTPALLKLLRDAVEPQPDPDPETGQVVGAPVLQRLRSLLGEHFPDLELDEARLQAFASSLVAESEVPRTFLGTALMGHLSATKLAGVLSMLDASGARGVLQVEDGPTMVRLHLDRGRIRLAEAEGVEEDLRLGRFVVAAGFLNNDELEAVARADDPARRHLGQRLVEDGYLRKGELARVLLNQARDVTCHLLEWDEGRYSFEPAQSLHPLAEANATARAELKISEVLLEGLRRFEEQAEMGPDMPGVDDIFLRDDEAVAKAGRNAFTREELGVLELLNGRNSLKEIARKTRAGAFAVTKIMYRLWKAGFVHRRTNPVRT
jgi:hypothetical protein